MSTCSTSQSLFSAQDSSPGISVSSRSAFERSDQLPTPEACRSHGAWLVGSLAEGSKLSAGPLELLKRPLSRRCLASSVLIRSPKHSHAGWCYTYLCSANQTLPNSPCGCNNTAGLRVPRGDNAWVMTSASADLDVMPTRRNSASKEYNAFGSV